MAFQDSRHILSAKKEGEHFEGYWKCETLFWESAKDHWIITWVLEFITLDDMTWSLSTRLKLGEIGHEGESESFKLSLLEKSKNGTWSILYLKKVRRNYRFTGENSAPVHASGVKLFSTWCSLTTWHVWLQIRSSPFTCSSGCWNVPVTTNI